jgi:hypothetical protein
MKKTVLTTYLIISLFFTFSVTGRDKRPFSNLKFDKVMMYDFVGGKGTDLHIVNDNGKLAKTIIKNIQLNQETIKLLSTK